MESELWAYFSAIIDGEGHLGESKNGLIINTTNQNLAKWLRRKIGGKLSYSEYNHRKNSKHLPSWKWRISKKDLVAIAHNFERFLFLKRNNLERWKIKSNYPLNSGNPKGNPDPRPLIAETDAYLAGLIDGEGTVFIRVMNSNSPRGKQYLPLISITSCDEKLIDWLIAKMGGGKVFVRLKNIKHRDRWYWSCGANLTRKVVKRIEKYAIVKAPHLKQLKKFLNLPRTNTPSKWWYRNMPIDQNGRWLTPHGYKRAKKIIKTISILNRKHSLLIQGEGRETIKGDGDKTPKI